jgi:hypothetical protein
MSALLNALTTTPEASRAQLVADGAARTAALKRWQGELNKYSDDKYRNPAVILPDDIQYLKAFLRKRVDAITTNTRITTSELVALDQNVDTLNYQTLLDTYALRNTLVGTLVPGGAAIDAGIEDLRKKGVSVPADFYAFKSLVAAQKLLLENDLRGARLMTKDVLQDKMAAFGDSVTKLPTLRGGAAPKTIEEGVELLKKAAIDAALQAQENPIKNILSTSLGIAGTVIGVGALLVLGLLSSSYAMNSMVHHGILFRIGAGLYGLVFMPVVLIYYWVNRLFISKKVPKSFAFLPLLEGDRAQLSRTVALFFSFLYFSITESEKERMMRGEVVEAPTTTVA